MDLDSTDRNLTNPAPSCSPNGARLFCLNVLVGTFPLEISRILLFFMVPEDAHLSLLQDP